MNVIQLVTCDKKKIKVISADNFLNTFSYIGIHVYIYLFNLCFIQIDLTFLSTQYNGSTILLVGNTLSDVVHDAIEEVISNNVRNDINMLISSLTEKLECFINR